MAIDLSDLIANLKVEVNPPGQDLFATATDTEWTTRLANAFWNARLDGMLSGYVESEGFLLPVSGTTDMPRDLQQVLVFLAGYAALTQRLSALRTKLRAKAGPTEFETENAATVLHDQFLALRDRMNRLLYRLSDVGIVPDYVIDAVQARADSLAAGITTWVR